MAETQYQDPYREKSDYLTRRIKAHEIVRERWQEQRPTDLETLRDIYERHVEDPLYDPVEPQYSVEQEWYDEIERETARLPQQVKPFDPRWVI